MDLLKEMGGLALASRFKRLGESISQDVAAIYRDQGIPFEPRWCLIFYLLTQQESPVAMMDIARRLGVTHPAVNQLAGEMERAGLVETVPDPNDKRRRLLGVTDKARALLPVLEPLWDDIAASSQEILAATGVDVLGIVENIEQTLEQQGYFERYLTRKRQRQQDAVEVLAFQPAYRHYFRELNEAWISKYFALEPTDRQMLEDPESQILAAGGEVLFARYGADIVGTCALIKRDAHTYELAKLAVQEDLQGKQIGKKLLSAAIEKAKALGARRVILGTNSRLTRALSLYRKFGFTLDATVDYGYYDRVDMVMALDLQGTPALAC